MGSTKKISAALQYLMNSHELLRDKVRRCITPNRSELFRTLKYNLFLLTAFIPNQVGSIRYINGIKRIFIS